MTATPTYLLQAPVEDPITNAITWVDQTTDVSSNFILQSSPSYKLIIVAVILKITGTWNAQNYSITTENRTITLSLFNGCEFVGLMVPIDNASTTPYTFFYGVGDTS